MKARVDLGEIASISLPFCLAFIHIPVSLYAGNEEYFSWQASMLLFPALVGVVGSTCSCLIAGCMSRPGRIRFVRFALIVGCALTLVQMLCPLIMNEPSGALMPQSPFSRTQSYYELAAWLVSIGLVAIVPYRAVIQFGGTLAWAILIASFLRLAIVLPHVPRHAALSRDAPRALSGDAELSNMYHFIFDAFSADIFLSLAERHNLTHRFNGFTFFARNRANYLRTEESVPSFLTASYADLNAVEQWRGSVRSHGVIAAAAKAGYTVSTYIPGLHWSPTGGAATMLLYELRKRYLNSSQRWFFYDLCILRLAPVVIRTNVFWAGKGLISRLMAADSMPPGHGGDVFLSEKMLSELFKQEPQRPAFGQYVYVHVYLPHSPYIFRSDCTLGYGEATYEQQSACALQLMAKFIELLRQSGKYDRSAIVFQSDHAEYFRTSGFFPTMDEGKNNEIARSHLLGMNGHNIDARSRALLLIKPPYADDRPLQVLKRETQLLDLPATITALLKLPARYSLGVNVFTPDFPLERRIDMYDGFAQRGPNGKGVVRLGQQILSAYVNHYSYSSRDGWKVHPNEMAQW